MPDLTSSVTVQTEVARNGYPTPQDIRWTRNGQALRGHCDSDLAGVETPESKTPRRGEARPHYARDLPGSGASRPHLRVLRFRSPFQVRLLREARLVRLGDMSVCGMTNEEAVWPSGLDGS